MHHLSLAAALLLLPLCACAQTFDFKGVVLGGPARTDAIEAQLQIKCQKSTGEQACAGKSTMMSLPATVTVDISAGKVARMDIGYDRLLFRDAEVSLREKFGNPYGSKASMTVWRNKRGDLVILQRDGLLSYTSIEDQRANAEAVRKMKKDF